MRRGRVRRRGRRRREREKRWLSTLAPYLAVKMPPGI